MHAACDVSRPAAAKLSPQVLSSFLHSAPLQSGIQASEEVRTREGSGGDGATRAEPARLSFSAFSEIFKVCLATTEVVQITIASAPSRCPERSAWQQQHALVRQPANKVPEQPACQSARPNHHLSSVAESPKLGAPDLFPEVGHRSLRTSCVGLREKIGDQPQIKMVIKKENIEPTLEITHFRIKK